MMLHTLDYLEPITANVKIGPNIWLPPAGTIPTAIINEIEDHEVFASHMPNVWHRDALTGMIMPCWAPEDVYQTLKSAVYNLILQCPLSVKQWLEDRRMLLQPELNSEKIQLEHAQSLQKNHYTILRHIFPKAVIEDMTARVRELHAQGKFRKCTQVPERSAIESDPLMRYYHLQLTRYLNKIMPDKIKASYNFPVIYHEGAVLKRHTDRPQCLWNLSVVQGTVPDITMETAWPIYLEIDHKVHEVRLLPGDGVLYSGTDIPHWRDAQPPGLESVITFFHFVAHDFTESLN